MSLLDQFTPEMLKAAERRLEAEIKRRKDIERLENDFTLFVKEAWPSIDRSKFQPNWALDAVCEHLTAVSDGHIKRLLINIPFRSGKTTISSICYPAWTWARRQQSFTSGPGVRFLCGSYNHDLALTNSNQNRRLILSPWYQERWGKRFTLREDQNTKTHFGNTQGGSRIATSVGGSLLGIGGDIVLVDDPANTAEVESDADRATAIEWWKEVRTTRLNDPNRSALVVVMQRLHEQDISGVILEDDEDGEWTHLMIPMRHEIGRHCVTVLKWDKNGEPAEEWEDPRTEENELMWPERFDATKVEAMERELGSYMASGRLQQLPVPAGGGIIKSDHWQTWDREKFPDCEFILASLDTAYTEKEENDASALTIWGVFREKEGNPNVMLLGAWEGRLELHDLVTLVAPVCGAAVSAKELDEALELYNRGAVPATMLPRLPVDKLLIEAKASGMSVGQEMSRLYGNKGNFSVELVDPKKWGDKTSRLVAIEPMFADQMVYAPVLPDGEEYRWVRRVIDNVAAAPKTTKWDTPDSVSMALRYLRVVGLLKMRTEVSAEMADSMLFRPKQRALYD